MLLSKLRAAIVLELPCVSGLICQPDRRILRGTSVRGERHRERRFQSMRPLAALRMPSIENKMAKSVERERYRYRSAATTERRKHAREQRSLPGKSPPKRSSAEFLQRWLPLSLPF